MWASMASATLPLSTSSSFAHPRFVSSRCTRRPKMDAYPFQPNRSVSFACHTSHSRVEGLEAEQLRFLLHSPHPLLWQRIDGRGSFIEFPASAKDSAALRPLANLREFFCGGPKDITWLADPLSLPKVTRLGLCIHGGIAARPWDFPAPPILFGLTQRSALTSLALTAPLTAADMAQLLPRLPHLRHLQLWSMRELSSLSFFLQCEAAHRTLELLELSLCQHLGLLPTELLHLIPLKALTSLAFLSSFCADLPQFAQQLCTPPSTAFPLLQTFRYEPRSQEEDGADEE